ncbi:hypothetical protein OH76DRAFT_1557800 [Lentinus brumalis]|uniref:Uncharacterized protein n=1 Tax=Lentinus brumalis TaxID=2498619 RepID=A0A371D4E5_9APHY|nr:hypothetical protein OH76DRAFT_1557800 [Polyporus brumalis]
MLLCAFLYLLICLHDSTLRVPWYLSLYVLVCTILRLAVVVTMPPFRESALAFPYPFALVVSYSIIPRPSSFDSCLNLLPRIYGRFHRCRPIRPCQVEEGQHTLDSEDIKQVGSDTRSITRAGDPPSARGFGTSPDPGRRTRSDPNSETAHKHALLRSQIQT